ncbi:MAG: OmpH family outer membrane protein [Planctomycetota bacterium]|jgi:Skp family chaperone for outer membrane proteins
MGYGCGQSQPAAPAPPTVAIVDQMAVAKALGADQNIVNLVQQANAQLSQAGNAWLEEQKTALQAEYDALGEDATEEQKQEFEAKLSQVNAQLQQVQQGLEQRSQSVQLQLALSFRNSVMQAAQPIAESRGASMILNANDAILWYASSIDITGEVITALRAKQAELKAMAPAPAPTTETTPDASATEAPAETAPAIEGLDIPAEAPAPTETPNN